MINQETLKLFEKFYNNTYKDIVKYVVCNCSNMEDVKDITQNIYLAVFKKMVKINDDNYNAYIMGIAKNKVKDYYRFKYRSRRIEFESEVDDIVSECDLESDLILNEDIDKIWNFLKNKNVIIFKIFYLYYYCDMNLKEISISLNITESNVKNYLYRTLKQIRKEWDNNE